MGLLSVVVVDYFFICAEIKEWTRIATTEKTEFMLSFLL